MVYPIFKETCHYSYIYVRELDRTRIMATSSGSFFVILVFSEE
jgi:hypothetical protein